MKCKPSRSVAALAAVLGLMLSAGPLHAQARGYVLNGEAWMRLTPVERMAYAQGLNDYANFAFVDDDLATAVTKYARNRCLVETRATPNILADIITMGYTNQPQLMVEPPLYVYVVRLADICRTTINEERMRMGLPTQ
jgi:hypothetical protein